MSDGPRDARVAELLDQMRRGAGDALAFVDDMEREDFLTDLRTQRAVVMSLMIVGEAAARVAADHPDFTAGHPDVPWRAMRGMRNRIAHGYFEIDLDVVWRTVCDELPALMDRVDAIQP